MDISHLFSSTTKYKLLRTLSTRSSPIHLRALVDVTAVPLRSAQLAIHSFTEQKLLSLSKESNRVYIKLNDKNPYAIVLQNFFQNDMKRQLRERSQKYTHQGSLLTRIHELRMLSWQKNANK